MKKIPLLILIVASAFAAYSQNNYLIDKPRVDNRVELLSIVFRLAECREFTSTRFKLYTDKIENHFSPYKDHELISFIQKIRKTNGIGYDAVMSMAIHIDENLQPLKEFTEEVPDKRWGKKNANEFIKLLQKFYQDAACSAFFESNKSLYNEVSSRFLPVYEKIDLNWYQTFYGKDPTEKFIIVNGLGNGGGNYGPSIMPIDSRKEVYAIMGTWGVDSLGMAEFKTSEYFPVLLHEFNHSFVNELLNIRKNEFIKSGEKIFAAVEHEMTNQAYGSWGTMMNEALVRASVIKYMKDHNFDRMEIEAEIREQEVRGFLWISKLVDELEKYDNQRKTYLTLESYLPKLAEAYKTYANTIEQDVQKYDAKRPQVISINEFKNGTKKVSASIKTITINFDKPLLGKGYSINYGKKGEEAYPKFGDISYSEDKKSVILEVALESNKEYQFILTGRAFKSTDKIAIKDFEVNIKTK